MIAYRHTATSDIWEEEEEEEEETPLKVQQ